MRSSADDAADLAVEHTYTAFRKDVDDRSTWIVVDFVDIVIHLFEPNTRAHYDLEMLWADAPRLEWERPDQMNRNRASRSRCLANGHVSWCPRPGCRRQRQ